MLVIYILSWSLFTGLIGAATSFLLLLGMRLACGLGQAGAYPTSASLISKWVPFSNRGMASSVVAFGGRAGGTMAPLLTAYLMVLFVPMSVPAMLELEDILSGERLCAKLAPLADATSENGAGGLDVTRQTAAGRRLWSMLSSETQQRTAEVAQQFRSLERQAESLPKDDRIKALAAFEFSQHDREQLAAALNKLLPRTDLYGEEDFRDANLAREAVKLLRHKEAGRRLTDAQMRRLNRLLLEGAFRVELGKLYVHGWRPVMYVYGLVGLLVAAVFWICFRDRPEQHPWCNDAERELVTRGRPPGAPGPHGKPGMIPLGRLLRSRSMWFSCLSQVGTNIGWVFLVTWLPRYLVEVHEVPILERGVMSMVPLLVGIVGMLCGGILTDWLVPNVGLRWGRRFPLMITRFTAALGYALCLWFASQSSGSWLGGPWMFVMAFSLVALSTDMGNASSWAFNQDVGGRYVGSILGWGNMWGNLGAAISPPIYNAVLGESPDIAQWNWMFAICMGALIFSGLCALGIDATIPIAPADEEHESGEDDDTDSTAS